MKLNVREEITRKWQNHNFLSDKSPTHYIKSCKQQNWWFLKTHIIFAIRFNVLQFVHMRLIVLAVLFKPSLLWIVTLTFNILASACYPLVEACFPFVNGRCIFNGPCHHWPLVTETLVENRDTREICSLNDKSRRYCNLYSLLKYSRRHLCKANLNNKYSNLRLALATVTSPLVMLYSLD